jgi:hypothetical protein
MVQLTKKELVKTAKKYNDKSCIKKVSTLSKNQLVSQLHAKGVKVKKPSTYENDKVKHVKKSKYKSDNIKHGKNPKKDTDFNQFKAFYSKRLKAQGKTIPKDPSWLKDSIFDDLKYKYYAHLNANRKK